jgi:hypothetical protein
MIRDCVPSAFDFTQNEKEATLRTEQLQVTIRLDTGQLFFRNAKNDLLLFESDRRPREYIADTVNGEKPRSTARLKLNNVISSIQ